MPRIIKYVLYDILRTRFILFYTLFLLLCAVGMYQLDSDTSKVVLSLMNILLIVVPLVSIVFTTIHFYNSYEFIELLAAQPLKRRSILLAEFLGVSITLGSAFLLGIGVPVALFAAGATGFTLIATGLALTLVFLALAFLGAVITRDKARGIGMAMLLWFYFAILHDGLMLFVMFYFGDYPMEKATIGMIALNPIDLGRVIVLLQMDVSALMGYTGAMMKDLLGSALGITCGAAVMALWAAAPLAISLWRFQRKDL
jgi:Cu-processing system permease protein